MLKYAPGGEGKEFGTLEELFSDILNDAEQCAVCCQPLTRKTAWLPDNRHDKRRYCYEHAPADAIRQKDLI